MSIVIFYTVLIEYKTGVSRYSQTPQDNVVASLLCFRSVRFPKETMDLPRIERGYLRCKRSILPLDYRPLSDLKTIQVPYNNETR